MLIGNSIFQNITATITIHITAMQGLMVINTPKKFKQFL